jgi:hypothetical protein
VSDFTSLPADLPAPVDDGAADHLLGAAVPRISLPATSGAEAGLAELAADLLVAYIGMSAQSEAEQAEFAAREHIPYPLLADPGLRLAAALGLPTFEVEIAGEPATLYSRLTFVAEGGVIVKTFYPVFPPDRDAADVLAWLASR